MESIFNVVKRMPLLLETLFVVLVPSSTDVEAEMLLGSNSEYILNQKAETVGTEEFVQVRTMMEERIDLEESIVYDQLSEKAWKIAKSLEWRTGNCYEICMLFVNQFYGPGYKISEATIVDEPRPGDLIYYSDGGLGIEHWGVFLGGTDALQGNHNGYARLKSVYIRNASAPIFYRMNQKNND
ncbi:MAG: hypothetical protein Q4B60_06000 [Erysipelotrichaceae bacterium]|nr:hypothetical protein [Erysipelotrichaceae bacterium]